MHFGADGSGNGWAADGGGRLWIGGREVLWRLKSGPARQAQPALRRGFHRLRLDGFNLEYGSY